MHTTLFKYDKVKYEMFGAYSNNDNNRAAIL